MKLRNLWVRTLALVLALLLTFSVSACGSQQEVQRTAGDAGADIESTDTSTSVGMGRFKEVDLELPPGDGYRANIAEVNGKLRVVMSNGIYDSADGGESWEPVKLPEKAAKRFADKTGVVNTAWGADGAFFYIYMEQVSENDYRERYAYVDADGTERDLDIKLPDEPENMADNTIMSNTALLSDGSIVALDNYNSLLHIDQNTGEILHRISEEYDGLVHFVNMSVTGNTAILFVDRDFSNKLELYDLETWEQKASDEVLNDFIKEPGGGLFSYTFSYDPSQLSFDHTGRTEFFTYPGEDALYIATSRGLYRHILGGTAMEQIMDGGLYSLSDPSRYIYSIIKTSWGDFYASYQDYNTSEDRLIRWEYDAGQQVLPENQVKVFALYDNAELRRAVAMYQRSHPEVYFTLEIGMEDGSSQDVKKTARALAETIQDGQGPDLLVLDGLPYREFIRDGLLEDITGLTDGLGVMDNLISAFDVDEKSYVAPARFSVPVVMGDKEIIKDITDLESFAEAVESLREAEPDRNILELEPERLVEVLVAGSSWELYQDDGSIDRDMLARFLQLCGRIYKADALDKDGGPLKNTVIISIPGSFLAGGYASVTKEVIGRARDFGDMATLMRQFKNVDYTYFSGFSSKVFTPNCILGISSASEKKDICRELIKLTLSYENQCNNTGVLGLPVNMEALQELIFDKELGGGYGILGVNGEQVNVGYRKANGVSRERLLNFVQELKTPSYGGETLFQALEEYGGSYIDGSIELENALDRIIAAAE